jgi:conjugative coupling factor TraD (TOL family)
MTGTGPIEALLRPPMELWSAAVALLAASVAVIAPWAFLMPPEVAWAGAFLLALVAWVRGRQAWRVLRYRRNMRRLPRYRLAARRIPLSRHRLFLGRGFRWAQRHTQRLRDARRPEVRRYVEPGFLYQWARRQEATWERSSLLRPLATLLRADVGWNPLRPLPPVGGSAVLHAVEPDEEAVWMPLGERVGHTLVLGTTRVGKTRLAELLIAQDIRRGDVVIVFDPKGDADLLRRVYAEAQRAGRSEDLYVFHLGRPELSARYNAIGNFSRITEVATRIANQLPAEGNSAAFKEFAWRFVNIIARALVELGRRPDYHQVRRHINDIEPLFVEYARATLERTGDPDWARQVADRAARLDPKTMPLTLKGRGPEAVALYQTIEQSDFYEPVLEGLMSAFKYDRTYFDKIVSSVGPLMEKLTTGAVAELISPDYLALDDPRPIFDWLSVIRQRGIVYVGLDALSDTTVAGAVGNSMFADLVSVAGSLYKHGLAHGLPAGIEPPTSSSSSRPAISLHADEFNELIGDEFIPMVNKAGGAGFQVTAYTQTWSDVEARVGSRAKAGQVAGNFNTLIMLRVKELATAEMLTEQLPRVEVSTLMQVSGVNDSSTPGSGVDFTSRNEDRISVTEAPLIGPSEVVSLPKGQAFALLEGGQLWKLRMPLPDAAHDPAMPEDVETLAREMLRRYRSSEDWYRDGWRPELAPWRNPIQSRTEPTVSDAAEASA